MADHIATDGASLSNQYLVMLKKAFKEMVSFSCRHSLMYVLYSEQVAAIPGH